MKIQTLRKEIDNLDQKISKNLEKRLQLANQIITIKKQNNLKIEDKTREKEILNNLPENKLIKQIYLLIFKTLKK
tara:strand:- start:440 stop:664 length:225 start_codon:yes stop_codon:yes gene_type:complete